MAPRSIAFTEEEDRILDDLVRSGRFRDADEVVREGIRLVAADEQGHDLGYTLDEVRAAVQVGLDDIAAGRYVEFNNEAKLRAYFEALAEAAQPTNLS